MLSRNCSSQPYMQHEERAAACPQHAGPVQARRGAPRSWAKGLGYRICGLRFEVYGSAVLKRERSGNNCQTLSKLVAGILRSIQNRRAWSTSSSLLLSKLLLLFCDVTFQMIMRIMNAVVAATFTPTPTL